MDLKTNDGGAASSDKVCFRCGHVPGRCTFLQASYFACQKRRHMVSVCQSRRQVQAPKAGNSKLRGNTLHQLTEGKCLEMMIKKTTVSRSRAWRELRKFIRTRVADESNRNVRMGINLENVTSSTRLL